jgi:hypothetical protein
MVVLNSIINSRLEMAKTYDITWIKVLVIEY